MSQAPLPSNEWLKDLLADQALEGLDTAQRIELERLANMETFDREALERAAALVNLAMVRNDATRAEEMPADVRAKLDRLADAFVLGAGASGASPRAAVKAPPPPPPVLEPEAPVQIPGTSSPEMMRPVAGRIGWTRAIVGAVAAALVMGAFWYYTQGRKITPEQQRATIIAGSPDVFTIPWGDWGVGAEGPELKGVMGDVVWSDAAQQGVMRFTNLPALKAGEQYQLWIIDKDRGMEQRISGGIFDGAPGEQLVPIEPQLRVGGAAAFAVTIEKQGGVVVSDMKRRVVIAARPS